MNTTSGVRLALDAANGCYQPGDVLTGHFQTDGPRPQIVRAAELSVLWHTSGKGEEDLEVHYFERLVHESVQPLDLRVPRPFSTQLPLSPLSYDGLIVKVCWCVRLRLFLPRGQEALAETAFRLGNVPPARGAWEH